uniref:Creatinine amidohydrolase n=1 Tax=Tetraselmis sp. GSL018 TaxID=582737 RepID=A0A061S3H6_9CHLO|mmetsp:Transcript_23374/g.55920  ORF Transcript_23374/g.55920 Transcript_23374/m.55920 type:complete len:407 (-) Transcript_23374:350-1570(-)
MQIGSCTRYLPPYSICAVTGLTPPTLPLKDYVNSACAGTINSEKNKPRSWKAGSERNMRLCSTTDSQHGPPCRNSAACFLDLEQETEVEEEAKGAHLESAAEFRGPKLPKRRWDQMTTTDFRSLAENGIETIAVLPVSATEQHGPHLPCSVDANINEGILERALELLDPRLPVTVLPEQRIGKSNEHSAFPGTLSLSAETLTNLWLDIGDSVYRAGVRKLVLFNSHGGQPQVMDIVARELRVRHGMLAVALSWFGFGLPDGAVSRHEQLHGIHGGEIETSMMLHLRPGLVRMRLAEDFVPSSVELCERFRLLRPEGGVGFGWMAQDLHPSGAMGNAAAATPEKGRLLVEHAASRLAELLREVDAFPLSALRGAGGEPAGAEAATLNGFVESRERAAATGLNGGGCG